MSLTWMSMTITTNGKVLSQLQSRVKIPYKTKLRMRANTKTDGDNHHSDAR